MSTWPAPPPEIQHLLRNLPSGVLGQPMGPLWQAFQQVKTADGKKPKAQCIFCSSNQPISSTAQVMKSHVTKCPTIPLEVRQYLLNAQATKESFRGTTQQQEIAQLPSLYRELSTSSTVSITPSMSASHVGIPTFGVGIGRGSMPAGPTLELARPPSMDIAKSNQLLLEAMIEGGAPLNLVDSPKFKEFIYSINPWYHLPARKQLSDRILNDIHKRIEKATEEFISKSDWIILVVDGWQNIRQDHLVGVMAIGKDRRSEVIDIRDTHGESQTAEVILRDMEEAIEKAGYSKVGAVISDGAANYVRMKAMLANVCHVMCHSFT